VLIEAGRKSFGGSAAYAVTENSTAAGTKKKIRRRFLDSEHKLWRNRVPI